MIHHTAHFISLPLSLIFNSSLSSGIFPSDWKNSFVTPIPKYNSSSPSNFRPISLLPLISKVLERHVINYMYDFCLSHKLLSDSQFGFRPGFSTETALLSLLHFWHTSLDSNNSVCSVIFDLTKAFDSVPHKPLLDCLSAIDLPSPLLVGLITIYLIVLSKLLLMVLPLVTLMFLLVSPKVQFLASSCLLFI